MLREESALSTDQELANLRVETEQINKDLTESISGPEVSSPMPSVVVVGWKLLGYYFTFTNLHENGKGLIGELDVRQAAEGPLHWGDANLKSLDQQEKLIRKLSAKLPLEKIQLSKMVEKSFYLAAKTFRTGAPAVLLKESTLTTIPYAINPILPKGASAVIFGDGGSAKSFFSLFIAVAAISGIQLPNGITAEKSCPLVLDWEEGQEETERRLTQICRGLNIPFQPIHYLHMSRALADDLSRVRNEVSSHNASLLIVDSMAPAMGAEPESADSAVRLFNALRALPTSNLIIAHVSKQDARDGGPARPYGSVFNSNLARSTWEARATQDEEGSGVSIGLYHRKCNSGRLRMPMGFKVGFDSEMICLYGHDLSKEPELMKGTSIPHKIKSALKTGSLTAEEISEEINIPLSSVRSRLTEMKHKGRIIEVKREGKVIWWGVKDAH